MTSIFRLAAIPTALLCVASISAQSPEPASTTLADRFTHISTFNSLDASDMGPWHLKIAYQIFDHDGKPTAQGTAEQWWVSKEASRLVLTQADMVETYITSGGQKFHSAGAGSISPHVQQLLQLIVHPINVAGVNADSLKTREQTLGTLKADCLSATVPVKTFNMVSGKVVLGKDAPVAPGAFSPTFCVTSDDVLRAALPTSRVSVAYNQVGTFQAHSIAVKVTVSEGDNTKMEGHIDQLTAIDAGSVDLSTNGLTPASADPVRISPGVTAGQIVYKAPMSYPESARASRISGYVIIRALIGKDGHVSSTTVISSPDPRLSAAALDSVKHWVYKPFLLNGVPASVDTTITVNFNVTSQPSPSFQPPMSPSGSSFPPMGPPRP